MIYAVSIISLCVQKRNNWWRAVRTIQHDLVSSSPRRRWHDDGGKELCMQVGVISSRQTRPSTPNQKPIRNWTTGPSLFFVWESVTRRPVFPSWPSDDAHAAAASHFPSALLSAVSGKNGTFVASWPRVKHIKVLVALYDEDVQTNALV